MRVLLVQPRICAEAAYPLGLASLVPPLVTAGHDVEGLDLSFASRTEVDDAVARSDAICITVMTRAIPQARALVARVRSRGADTPVVLGGPHPTLRPIEALRETDADVSVVGDGEFALPLVLEAVRHGEHATVPGTAWRLGDEVRRVDGEAVEDLDALPPPDRRVFPIARYSHAMRSMAQPYTTATTSRGCRRACVHCPAPRLQPGGFRARSPDLVHAELEELSARHGVRCVQFEDDDLLADRGHIERLCDELIRRPLPLVWESVNGVPPENVDEPLLRGMARAGCRSLVFGIEALGPPQGDNDRRSSDPIRIAALVRAAERLGIRTGGYFILGTPGESLPDALHTVRRSFGVGLSRANYVPFQWLAGSADDERRAELAAGTIPRATAGRLAVASHVGFYLQPRALLRLFDDLRRDPRVARALFSKGLELAGIPLWATASGAFPVGPGQGSTAMRRMRREG